MKRIIYLICLPAIFLLTACDQTRSHSEDEHGDHPTTTHDGDHGELALNNGAKWTVDDATAENYTNLENTTNMFAVNPNPSLDNYQTFGNEMGEGINKMLRDCRMQGADHDALHVWLEPIMADVNDLKNVTDTARAHELFQSVHTRVNLYHDYFQKP